MTDDLGPEDRTLGTALSRAVEAQSVRETRFEDSRLGVTMNKPKRGSFLLPALATVAAIVLGVAVGAMLLDRRDGQGGVATQPPPSAVPTATGPTSQTAQPSACAPEQVRIWFARDGLPPVAGQASGGCPGQAGENGIDERVGALFSARAPAGTFNVVSDSRRPGASLYMSVAVSGDLATVRLGATPALAVTSAAGTQAFVQQLVYTITEEPGIRRALLQGQDGSPFVVDQMVWDKPLTREDVFGYSIAAERRLDAQDEQPRSATATATVSNEVIAPGLGRLTVELRPTAAVQGGFWTPPLTAELLPTIPPSRSKWALSVTLPGVSDPRSGSLQGAGPFQEVDGSPIQGLRIRNEGAGVTYELYLDDARPWRIGLEPGANGTVRLLVDVGGHPTAITTNTAVYSPRVASTVSRTFTVSGLARAFEATVSWRLRDSGGREVAKGFTNASMGTSPIYGTFTLQVQLPATVSGNVTLDVFQASPRDGSDTNKVEIPLEVR